MKTKNVVKCLLGWLVGLLILCQAHAYEVDDSYTVASAFAKYHKKYPHISIADMQLNDDIGIQLDRVYATINGRELHLDLFVPQNAQPKATVILIHGGGWRSGNKSHLFPLAAALAKRDYLAITVEYRLSIEALYPAGLEDVNRAILWLKKHAKDYQIDSRKVALLGGSSGGHMAALLANTSHLQWFKPKTINGDTDVQAVIDLDGIMDITSELGLKYEDKNGQTDSALALWLGGNYASQTERWKQASPVEYISANSPPMLFIGSGQTRFAEGRKKAFAQLDKWQIYHQSYDFDNSPHSFWLFHPWFNQVVEKVDSFLSKQFRYSDLVE